MERTHIKNDWFVHSRPWWLRGIVLLWRIYWLVFSVVHLRFRKMNAATRIAGLRLQTRLSVYHPKYSPAITVLSRWLQKQDLREKHLLDAGAGTGLLAILAACQGAHVLAIDRDPQAVQLARQNVRLHNLKKVICCEEVESLASLELARQFDLILFNPSLFVPSAGTSSGLRDEESLAMRWLPQAHELVAEAGYIVLALPDTLPLPHYADLLKKSGYIFADHQRKIRLSGYIHLIVLSKAETAIPNR